MEALKERVERRDVDVEDLGSHASSHLGVEVSSERARPTPREVSRLVSVSLHRTSRPFRSHLHSSGALLSHSIDAFRDSSCPPRVERVGAMSEPGEAVASHRAKTA